MRRDDNKSDKQKKEFAGVVGSLSNALFQGRKFEAKSEIMLGFVKRWTRIVRSHLEKVYGEESEVLGKFPIVEDTLSPTEARRVLVERLNQLEGFVNSLIGIDQQAFSAANAGKIFIGHGRSPIWREVKDFIVERLKLPCDEFNRESVAGLPTFERLSQMMDQASFAFLIMTAEDEHVDATLHARENVIHEVGLFQGRLGSRKAIVLLEDGCQKFTNIDGQSHILFPPGHVTAAFEDMRRVLEREVFRNR